MANLNLFVLDENKRPICIGDDFKQWNNWTRTKPKEWIVASTDDVVTYFVGYYEEGDSVPHSMFRTELKILSGSGPFFGPLIEDYHSWEEAKKGHDRFVKWCG